MSTREEDTLVTVSQEPPNPLGGTPLQTLPLSTRLIAQYHCLTELSQAIAQHQSLSDLWGWVVATVAQAWACDRVIVRTALNSWDVVAAQGDLTTDPTSWWSSSPLDISWDAPIISRWLAILSTGQSWQPTPQSYCVPIQTEQGLWGMFLVEQSATMLAWTEQERQGLTLVVQQMAIALQTRPPLSPQPPNLAPPLFLHHLLNTDPNIVFVKDWDDHIIWANQAFAQKYNCPLETIIGKTTLELGHHASEEVQGFIEQNRHVIQTQTDLLIPEACYTDEQGRQQWWQWLKRPFSMLGQSQQYVLGIGVDVTQHRYAMLALQRSERRYVSLAELVPVGIFHADAQGHLHYVNEQWTEIMGIPAIEAIQARWLSLLCPEGSDLTFAHWHQSLSQSATLKVEHHYQHPDGSYRWLLEQTTPERNSAGQIIGYLGTIIDISDRKTQETRLQRLNLGLEQRVSDRTAALEATTGHLMALIQTLHIGVLATDATAQVVLVNKGFRDLFPTSSDPETAVGLPLLTFLTSCQDQFLTATDFIHHYQDCLNRRHRSMHGELELATGHILEWDCVPILQGDHYHGSLSMYRDITARKQVERHLRDSEERFRAMFEQAAMGIAQLDLQGRFIRFNQRLCDILGYDAATLQHKHLYDVEVSPHSPDGKTTARAPMQLHQFLCGARETYAHEQQYQRADGCLVWGYMTLSLVRQVGGEPNYFIAILDDVSDRKQAEAEILRALATEKELSELKTRLIDMASHEFRTPLTTILGSVELLRLYGQQWDETKRHKYLQRLQDAGLRMKALVDNVFTASRANTDRITLTPHSFDVITCCRNLIDELSMAPVECPTITLQTEGHLRQCSQYAVYLEERLLHHILSNLLSNAMKYSPPDSLIHVSLAVEEHSLIIRIEDQGIGIPVADQDRIFEAFHRARNVGKVAGTGLGLNIVKKYVELQGGNILFCSQEGFGTTFRVALPLAQEVVE